MADVRGTQRRQELDSCSPGPAETGTTDLTFKTAEERTLPAVSDMEDDDDLKEVSSPARPTAASKLTRRVERLREGKQRSISCAPLTARWHVYKLLHCMVQRLQHLSKQNTCSKVHKH